MFWNAVAISALILRDASAAPQAGGGNSGSADFLRFGCSQLVVERTDPLVNPGLLPSPHVSFNALCIVQARVDCIQFLDAPSRWWKQLQHHHGSRYH